MNKTAYIAMPVLESLKAEFVCDKPLAGRGILLHMHMTQETVALGDVFGLGGARVVYLPSNRNPSPLAIGHKAREQGGIILEDLEQLDGAVERFRDEELTFFVVEGNGEIFSALHREPRQFACLALVRGISEHTSGGGRLVNAFSGRLLVPVVAVYRDPMKTMLETGLGTSQTVTAALLRGLEEPVAGRRVIVVGFGNVGRGLARMVRTLGGRVIIVEKSAERALEAHLEGFQVSSLREVLLTADICVTTTGASSVLTAAVLEQVKEGLVVTNVSNQPQEINLAGCEPVGSIGHHLVSWVTPGRRRFCVLGGGLQVNHVVEAGNPAELMDISFALHAMVLRWLCERELEPGVYSVPQEFRERVATLLMEESA